MNPLEILGKDFNLVQNSFPNSGKAEVYDELEDYEEQEYSVSAIDGTWEIKLGKNDIIKTIFLYLDKGWPEFNGINSTSTTNDIVKKFGFPSKKGSESTCNIIGCTGSWLRYDNPEYKIHFECFYKKPGIKMVTIMCANI